MQAEKSCAKDDEPPAGGSFESLKKFHSAGRGFWHDVADADWNDWHWQLKHRITSAEQLHLGKLNPVPPKGSDKRLFVDLDVCAKGPCEGCDIKCSYFYHPRNNGVISFIELVTYALVCRRCEEPHCVNACPKEALSQQKDKNILLVRHNMRCLSCKT